MMYFQQYVERKAFTAGGGKFAAPAQRLIDFTENKLSSTLPGLLLFTGHSLCVSKRSITTTHL